MTWGTFLTCQNGLFSGTLKTCSTKLQSLVLARLLNFLFNPNAIGVGEPRTSDLASRARRWRSG